MRAFLWSTALFAVGALALPGIQQGKRSSTASTDGSCGAVSGETCSGSSFGNCCSGAGYCGSNNTYCGQGCQSGYGVCTGEVNGLLISNDGTCGSGVTCQGSIFGDCCSNSGFWYYRYTPFHVSSTNAKIVVRRAITALLLHVTVPMVFVDRQLLPLFRLLHIPTALRLQVLSQQLPPTQLVQSRMVQSTLLPV